MKVLCGKYNKHRNAQNQDIIKKIVPVCLQGVITEVQQMDFS